MTEQIAAEAAAPLTAADIVKGQVFMMSVFAQTISGPLFHHDVPVLILPFHNMFPEVVLYRSISRSGTVYKTSHRIDRMLPRVRRPTEADKARITTLVERVQREIDIRQTMIDVLKPYTLPAKG